MTDIFISYKREDEARVAPLVEALKAEGLSLWWDREIEGGAAWRQRIIEHLEAAKCAIVVWTEASVAPAGEFVHEEADRAKARGVYLPVRLDRVDPPLGFGLRQMLDLVGWRGNRRDARFQDVAAAAKALIAGGPMPAPKAGRKRAQAIVSATTLAAALSWLVWLRVQSLGRARHDLPYSWRSFRVAAIRPAACRRRRRSAPSPRRVPKAATAYVPSSATGAAAL